MELESESEAWEFDDAEERHRSAPDYYSVPSVEGRGRIKAGDRVELFFLFRGRDQHGLFIQSERLPVVVRSVSALGFTGTLDASPVSSTLLGRGDSVAFEARHIVAIQFVSEIVGHRDDTPAPF